METLTPEVLNRIQPFYGEPTATDRIIERGDALQQVKTGYTTAVSVQKRREISRVTANVLEEAQLAGSAFYYRWEVFDRQKGRKVPIEGPSIDLAMCIARNYGNCAIEVESTETPTHYMMRGIIIDLETGFTCPRLFRQRKSQNLGCKMDTDRQEDIVFQIGQSKAIRNAIIKAMPSWLIDKAIDTAKQSELSSIKPENIHIARAKVMNFFSGYGIIQDRIEAKTGKRMDLWTAQDIVDLRGSATALKEGRVSPDELFPIAEQDEKTDTKQTEKHADEPDADSGPDDSPADARGGNEPDSAWAEENWKNLKGPGVKKLADGNLETFEQQPKAMQDAFRDKWSRCAELKDLMFPFNGQGQWIGYVKPDYTARNDPGEHAGGRPAGPEDMAMVEKFNELWVSIDKECRNYACEQAGCENTVNGFRRPTVEKIPRWIAAVEKWIADHPSQEQDDEQPPSFDDERF
jgi:hypothetical protein